MVDGARRMTDDGHWLITTAHHEHFVLRWAKKNNTNNHTQSSLWLIKRLWKSRKENPQKLTQLSSRSHPRHLVGKKDSTKRHHHRHHKRQPGEQQFPKPASLTFNNYFYLCLYLYITWISTNNNAPHLKSPKNQKQNSRLGTASNKNYWGASNLPISH